MFFKVLSPRMRTPVALSWFQRADYPLVRRLCVDGGRWPPTFEAWRIEAERRLRQIEADGGLAMRVHVEPRQFRDWCARHGLTADAGARERFVQEIVAILGQTQPPASAESGFCDLMREAG